MIISSPIMTMQISIPKLVIEIAGVGIIQCLEAGERERERERERLKKQKNHTNAHPQHKKRNKSITKPKIQKQFQV